jgi:hypothetical protein
MPRTGLESARIWLTGSPDFPLVRVDALEDDLAEGNKKI